MPTCLSIARQVRRAALVTAWALLCVTANGAGEGVADLAERADAAYRAENWHSAAQLYEQRVAAAPDGGRDWYRLGVASRHSGALERALAALAKAREFGVPASLVDVEVARVQVLAGQAEAALETLRRAVAAGFANPDALSAAPEFAALRDAADFAALVTQAQDNKTPCARRPPFRQFDFWLGEWDVHDAQGTFQGRNRISLREGGCYLFEEWTGAGGSTGSSINYYDAARARWVQHWVSQGGTQIQIEGGLDDHGSMLLSGRIFYLSNGQQADFRGRWTPLKDGRVRQFFEQSADGGDTWTPWFEGFYTRSSSTAQPQ